MTVFMRWSGALMILLGIGAMLAPLLDGLPAGMERPPRFDPLYCVVLGGFGFLTGWILVGFAATVRKLEHVRASLRRRLDVIVIHTGDTRGNTREIMECGTALAEALVRTGSKQSAPAGTSMLGG
jgi:hypothetical protein